MPFPVIPDDGVRQGDDQSVFEIGLPRRAVLEIRDSFRDGGCLPNGHVVGHAEFEGVALLVSAQIIIVKRLPFAVFHDPE